MAFIIVADSHIRPGGSAERSFFEMLAKMGRSRYDIVFLGDIFDLWIGLPGYEGSAQKDFLAWCWHQKHRRRIGLIEGNHEFFVSEMHAGHFSWSTSATSWRSADGCLFVHGDRLNPDDHRYLTFRRLTKNAVTKILLRGLPGGSSVCHRLRQALRHTNRQYRQGLPETRIRQYADQMFDDGLKAIFVGHFHSIRQFEQAPSKMLYLVPAWFASGRVTRVDSSTGALKVDFPDWKALP
jgi:UDP-2,3-diacylglucosamine pyrophosphatase LpxH